MIRVAILGGSGYSGAELIRLLARRSDVRLVRVTANSSVGQPVAALYPDLAGVVDLVFEEFVPDRPVDVDVAFVALPSGQGMEVVPALRSWAPRVIDLGGDFRLRSPELYQDFYQRIHTAPELLPEAVYGLPELNASEIAGARLVANPGCYPTSALLALLPALRGGIIRPDGIVINALSGLSGAGRTATVEMSFSEINENVRAYKPGTHQHIPEIESVLGGATGEVVTVSFVPHLIPITRGIYSTIHATLTHRLGDDEVLALYDAFYAEAPFVRVKRQIPQIQAVLRTNYCDLGIVVLPRTHQLLVISAIDNLVKGAAGQAIQNMNIMMGLPEEAGLR